MDTQQKLGKMNKNITFYSHLQNKIFIIVSENTKYIKHKKTVE